MKLPFREHHLFQILNAPDMQRLPMDVVLRDYFRRNTSLGPKDRRFIADTAYGLVRFQGLLDHLGTPPCSWEKRFALYSKTKFLEESQNKAIPPHIAVSFPKAFFNLLVESYGQEQALHLCRISNTQAPTTVRVNLLKTSREALFEKWRSLYPVALTEHSPWGIIFHRKINFFALEEFKAGLFEVQDEGSQEIAKLIAAKPRERVLDYCAGSGGKTLAIAPGMQEKGILYLHDIRPHALEEAKKRLKRAGVQNAQLLYPDDPKKKTLKGSMDWVLVDAPCTGTGTLRRNPDMKWKFDPNNLPSLLLEQQQIFEEALEFLHPQGKIVFATCSILPQENQEQIAHFQKQFSLTLVEPPFVSLPQEGGMDGFFGAILKKG